MVGPYNGLSPDFVAERPQPRAERQARSPQHTCRVAIAHATIAKIAVSLQTTKDATAPSHLGQPSSVAQQAQRYLAAGDERGTLVAVLNAFGLVLRRAHSWAMDERKHTTDAGSARSFPALSYVWLAVLGSVALIWALQFAFQIRAVLVILLFGVLFALVLVFPVDWLARLMPRAVAAVITLAFICALLTAAVYAAAPYFAQQLRWFADQIPHAIDRAHQSWSRIVPDDAGLRGPLGDELARLVRRALPVAFGALSGLSGALSVLALAMFLAYSADGAERGILRLVPERREEVVRDFLRRAGTLLQHWMLGQLASMTVTGALTAIGLLIVGINSWLVLGAISFVLEFVPYVGPLLSAVPGIATGLAVSTDTALWVAAVYLGVQLVESYVLQPLIMKRAARLDPALQIVWQLAMGSAFGILGVFVATPLLVCVQVSVQFFYVERTLGKTSS